MYWHIPSTSLHCAAIRGLTWGEKLLCCFAPLQCWQLAWPWIAGPLWDESNGAVCSPLPLLCFGLISSGLQHGFIDPMPLQKPLLTKDVFLYNAACRNSLCRGRKEGAGFGTGALGWHSEIVLLQHCSIVSSMLFTCWASSAHLLRHRGWRMRNLLWKPWASCTGSQFPDIHVMWWWVWIC